MQSDVTELNWTELDHWSVQFSSVTSLGTRLYNCISHIDP